MKKNADKTTTGYGKLMLITLGFSIAIISGCGGGVGSANAPTPTAVTSNATNIVDVALFDNLSTALADPTTAGKTISIGNAQLCNDVIVPAGRTLKLLEEGKLHIAAGKTVTIEGTIDAGDYEIFSGEGKIKLPKNSTVKLTWFGKADNDSTDVVPAIKKALSAIDAGGELVIGKGKYYADINSDSDTILVPSNVKISAEDEVEIRWDHWGAPLIGIVNKVNVSIANITFVWGGTFGKSVGFTDKFAYGLALPAYEWCAHIASVGSSNINLKNISCRGVSVNNTQNICILLRGANDRSTLTSGNVVDGLVLNDVSQGIIVGGQKNCKISNVTTTRYSNASDALYGPGHTIYHAGEVESDGLVIENITDLGEALSIYTNGSHTLSIKNVKNSTIRNISSKRDEGIINLMDNVNVKYTDIDYESTSTQPNTGNGGIYFVKPAKHNDGVFFDGVKLVYKNPVNTPPINMNSVSISANNIHTELHNVTISRNCNGTESTSAVIWSGDQGIADLTIENIGSGSQRVLVDARNGSAENVFKLTTSGAVNTVRIMISAGSNNTFNVAAASTIDNGFTPSNGNIIVLR